MRKLIAAAPMALALWAAPVMAGLYDSPAVMEGRLTRVAGYFAANGGEFTMQNLNAPAVAAGIVVGTYSDTAAVGGFQTFCLEYNEIVSLPTNYFFDITTYATAGGSGADGTGGPAGATSDSLDHRTAFLYTKFRDGSLASLGFNYAAGAGRQGDSGSAYQLQRAIWAIEGEQPVPASGLAKVFYDLANAAVNTGGDWYGMGLGNVRVMNLWGDAARTQYKQDQIVMIPAPGAMLLGAMGLGLIGWMKRRFA